MPRRTRARSPSISDQLVDLSGPKPASLAALVEIVDEAKGISSSKTASALDSRLDQDKEAEAKGRIKKTSGGKSGVTAKAAEIVATHDEYGKVLTESKRYKTPIVKTEGEREEPAATAAAEVPPKKTRERKVEFKVTGNVEAVEATDAAPKRKRKRKDAVEKVDGAHDATETENKPAKRKRKTHEEKEAEAMPLAARTIGHKMLIGAHVSGAGGVQNGVTNAVHIGANAFALFLKSQRKWANPPISPESMTTFHSHCKTHSYDATRHIVPHGSYLVNLAHTDTTRAEQAYDAFIDDLRRCESLGIKLYNFHPGNSVGKDRGEAIAHLAKQLNRAHRETKSVVTLLENMAAGGNVLGSTFEDLHDAIALVDDKDRVGICLDTCHAFAAGYDLRGPSAFKETLEAFDDVVGMQYLRALHLNDSKAPLAAHRDLHANIGTGFLGLRAFHNVMNEPRFEGLPMVLETPIEVQDENGVPVKDENGKEKEDQGIWATEIKLLESLVGMDAESEEFLKLENSLARKGESERKRLMEQFERTVEKDKKGKSPRKKRAEKAEEVQDESSGLC